MIIKIKRLNGNNLELPHYETKQSAGMDLRAFIDENIVIKPGERKLIKTGLSIELPVNYEAQVRSRSGLAIKNGVAVLNSPGTIDADYRGEIGVILINLGEVEFVVEKGMRIAQMVISPIIQAELIEVNDLAESERGKGGFGSTGV